MTTKKSKLRLAVNQVEVGKYYFIVWKDEPLNRDLVSYELVKVTRANHPNDSRFGCKFLNDHDHYPVDRDMARYFVFLATEEEKNAAKDRQNKINENRVNAFFE